MAQDDPCFRSNLQKEKSILTIQQELRIAEIRSRAKRLSQETGGLGLIVIDYLQLITGRGKRKSATGSV